jgi:hypothetical protein
MPWLETEVRDQRIQFVMRWARRRDGHRGLSRVRYKRG